MFKDFSDAVHKRYEAMLGGELYTVDVEDIFATYLASFPEGTNPIFRERTEHDCNCCKQFIRKLGKVVAITDVGVATVWDDYADLPHPYNIVSARMAALVRQAPIKSVFRVKEGSYGQVFNYDNATDQRWDHFFGKVDRKHKSNEPAEAIGSWNSRVHVFRRGLNELKLSAIDDVIDLIDNNGLYRGGEHKAALTEFRELKHFYDEGGHDELYIWKNAGHRRAEFRNTVIGTLIVDLSDGKPIEEAVRLFESKVAPHNYKRPSAVITPRMIEDAVVTLEKLGLEGAVNRRFARLEDVSVNDVLFVDNSVQDRMRDGLRGMLMEAAETHKPDIKNATEIDIQSFIDDIVPTADAMSVLVQNRHVSNFVSLTGGDGPERLFKWPNNFAWSYDGEATDSIKAKVKRAGGRVEGAKLRVSLAWFNGDDLDLHCQGPYGHIFYADKMGVLDVDMNAGGIDSREPVENQSFTGRLKDGDYRFYVNQFSLRENKDFGFNAEVEYAGRLEQFSYAPKVAGNIDICYLMVRGGEVMEMKKGEHMVGGSVSQDKWGIKTETLVPVNVLLNSPNHWNGYESGAKHWFFILKDCLNPEPVRGIYNEFLRGDLDKHRKVFEVLGSKTKCQPTADQLSGVGFTSARSDEVIVVVKAKGSNRTYNVKF